jgi:hypothetical protein
MIGENPRQRVARDSANSTAESREPHGSERDLIENNQLREVRRDGMPTVTRDRDGHIPPSVVRNRSQGGPTACHRAALAGQSEGHEPTVVRGI